MTRHPVVVDTNVVVAGILTARSDSPVARVTDGMLAAAFAFVISEALLAEYRAVLTRPELRKLHGLSVTEIDAVLTDLVENAIVIEPAKGGSAPEPGDQLLWNLLAAREDLLLVTGDKLLLDDREMRGRVISPREFVETLADR